MSYRSRARSANVLFIRFGAHFELKMRKIVVAKGLLPAKNTNLETTDKHEKKISSQIGWLKTLLNVLEILFTALKPAWLVTFAVVEMSQIIIFWCLRPLFRHKISSKWSFCGAKMECHCNNRAFFLLISCYTS